MAGLEFCPKHNMVAYLEKTDGNTEFHQIMDFLTRSSINYALTVSPIVSTSFVEQFWMTAKSRTVNNTSYRDAIVVGKPVTLSEASIRSDLLFDDADGIDSLNNQAIFDNIQLMGNQLKDVPVSLDHFPVPTLTKKVLTFMIKKGNNFSGKVTPLFDFMLVQQTEDEGEASEIPSDSPPIPSPPHLSQEAKERSQTTYHKSWIKSVALKTRLARKTSLKKKGVQKEYVSKQGRKSVKTSKGEPSVHKDLDFDDLDDDAMDYMETEDAQDEGRTSSVMLEEKESADKEVSTEAPVSTVKPNEGTDKRNKGTKKQDGGTDSTKVSTDRQGEGTVDQYEGKNATQTAPTTTSTPTPTIFGDDETIAQVLITMSLNKQKEKEKGVEIRNVKDTKRPRPTSKRLILTLRPLPKIDLKIKAEKKFKQLANDEEVARKVQEEWEAEEEKKRLDEEEATKAALSNEYDFIQARLNADKILAEKLQEEEREILIAIGSALFLFSHLFESEDITEAEKKFKQLANDEEVARKVQEEWEAKGEKKRLDEEEATKAALSNEYDFIQTRLNANKILAKKLQEEERDKDDIVKGEIKEEEGTRKRKLGKRKKMKSKKRKFTSKDEEELRLCLTIAPDEDKEVDYEILDKKYPIIEWRSEYLTTKPQYDETEEVEDVYLNVVIRSNRRRRYFSTLMAVLSILDRDDICAIYQLVMNRYQDETPEGFDKILWGDLIIMFNQSDSDEFWNAQQNWKIVSWKLHSSSGVHTIMTDEGVFIHIFIENKFVKKQIAELEPEDSDGDEKDL
ncbi:hypothetical protein Tco_1145893 [Tanacetum coccineum]